MKSKTIQLAIAGLCAALVQLGCSSNETKTETPAPATPAAAAATPAADAATPTGMPAAAAKDATADDAHSCSASADGKTCEGKDGKACSCKECKHKGDKACDCGCGKKKHHHHHKGDDDKKAGDAKKTDAPAASDAK